MWITQIDCREASIVQAPGGCNQYYFGREGTLKTFNFEGVQYLGMVSNKMSTVTIFGHKQIKKKIHL